MHDEPPPLASRSIPQANAVERLLDALLLLDRGASESEAFHSIDGRQVQYYRRALQILGAVDKSLRVTSVGRRCVQSHETDPHRAFAEVLSQSPIARAWMAWARVPYLSMLSVHDAVDFLSQRTTLSPATVRRRSKTLCSWLRFCEPVMYQPHLDLNPPPPLPTAEIRSASAGPWPDPLRMPHNQSGQRVEKVLLDDLRQAEWAFLVVGYASLHEMVSLLARWEHGPPRPLHILIGGEPRSVTHRANRTLDQEVHDEWTCVGLSLLLADDSAPALRALDRPEVQVRLAPSHPSQRLEARMYVTDKAAVVGSSNLTDGGLRASIPGNIRFEPSPKQQAERERHGEVDAYIRQLWHLGRPYNGDLKDLIEKLLRYVTWPEALARACWSVLDHSWIQRYECVRDRLPDLWPHQRDGIAQALHRLENAGAAMVCDPTGSGKTRLGSMLVRVLRDRHLSRHPWPVDPVVIAPKGVQDHWRKALGSLGLSAVGIYSDGLLSRASGRAFEELRTSLDMTELLVVDEAHRFISATSTRSRQLYQVLADGKILFTATPINRELDDLTAMVELIGPENFEPDVIDAILSLMKWRERGISYDERGRYIQRVSGAISQFMVRRTRSDIVDQIETIPGEYFVRDEGGKRPAGYPHRKTETFSGDVPHHDIQTASRIDELIDRLSGISWHKTQMKLSRTEPEHMVLDAKARVARFAGLARYQARRYLRSSRAALIWHAAGLSAAQEAVDLNVGWLDEAAARRNERVEEYGNRIGVLQSMRGNPPGEKHSAVLGAGADVPAWLYEAAAHEVACDAEAALYREIADLAGQLSDARDKARCKLLADLSQDRGTPVIGFEDCLVSLAAFHRILCHHHDVRTITGDSKERDRRVALEALHRDADPQPMIILASDCLTEGYNLQGATAAVHLNMPTTLRMAEQRMGRIDRIDSRHPEVTFYWPMEPEPFGMPDDDLLSGRWLDAGRAIGVNFELPKHLMARLLPDGIDGPVDRISLMEGLTEGTIGSDDFDVVVGDAFAPVRALINNRELVAEDIVERARMSGAPVLARARCPSATRPWCLAAVGGEGRRLPSWMLLVGDPTDGETVDIITNLADIEGRLVSWLSGATDEPPRPDTRRFVKGFMRQIVQHEDRVLSTRRRRAVEEAQGILTTYYNIASRRFDETGEPAHQMRADVCCDLYHHFTPTPRDEAPGDTLFQRGQRQPDIRQLADSWWHLTRPERARVRDMKGRARRLKTLRDFKLHLQKCDEIATERLAGLLAQIPFLPPVDERISAMLIGLPGGP